MKTTQVSLALAAGASTALASSPADYINLWGSSSASAPGGYASSSEASPVSSSAAATYSSAAGGYPTESGSDVVVTVTKTNTKVVCPCETTPAESYPAGPTRTPGEVYTTLFTTEYETTCPGEPETATFTYGDWTSLYTKHSMTTTTEIITATVTQPTYPASPVYSGSATSPALPSNTPDCWSSCFAKAGITGEADLCGNNKVTNCICDTCSKAEEETYKQWLKSYCSASSSPVSGSASLSYSSGAAGYSGSASSPQGYSASSSPGASGYSGTWSSPVASGSATGPQGYSGSASSPTGYASTSSSLPPYPSGSGSTYPVGTGTGVSYSHTIKPTGSSSTTSSYPTGTSSCVPCQGNPGNNPDEWCGYTIEDNYYEVVPNTCRTVEYHWNLENTTISPDGIDRWALTINGQMPGPMIEANWGDEIVVHLTNKLPLEGYNGTSLHFHGMRQNYTNEMDGVSSITQCPLAPGHTFTYRFRATQYGSSWYHSHLALQTYEGMFGPMMIHGPVQEGYEYDGEQSVVLQDWNHIPVDQLIGPSEVVGGPNSGAQTLDTGLINGLNVWENGGSRFQMSVQSGKSYRLRLVNTAIQSTFMFYVDQHELEVISMDYVPIQPYTTNTVIINIGQRYDVILRANQPAGNYWMRSDNVELCGNLTNSYDIKAIVSYEGADSAEPTSTAQTYTPVCQDEPYESLVPIVQWNAGAQAQTIDETVVIGPYQGTNLFKWTLDGTTFYSEWSDPTLESIYTNGTIPTTSGTLAIQAPELNQWVYVIVETPIPLLHPIHLHGHDFLILAQGLGTYSSSVALNLQNPPRRDVAVMPANPAQGQSGYLVVAFYTDNPGVWLMHCHIGWHNAMGFALQIIENLEGIADTIKYGGQMTETCASWDTYQNAYNLVTVDGGI